MDGQPAVVFRNVGQLYFPQTRLECHYSLSPGHQWGSSDWIGIFEVGLPSVTQYYTYTWALVPEDYTHNTSVDCFVVFQAFYLPRPSEAEYEFRYVDGKGEVCARSRSFTFCAPKPLEELETLREEEDEDEEDGEEGLLLVIPRAQLLQRRLEECLQKQEEIQLALDVTKEDTEKEKKENQKERRDWEQEREAMKEEISELRENMRENSEALRKMEGKHKEVKYSHEHLTFELSKLMGEKRESQQRIRELEEYIKALEKREVEGNAELERVKERVKKMSGQMKHDEERRKLLQEESETALLDARALQEHLEASEHLVESLRRELRELGARQGHTHTELQQARLQAAQLALQLSEENLGHREELASWALEREALKHASENDKKKIQELSCEVQMKEEWIREERMERERLEVQLGGVQEQNRVLTTDTLRELRELKACLKKKEPQVDLQSLMIHVHQLELKFGVVPDSKLSVSSSRSITSPLFLPTHPGRPGSAKGCTQTLIWNKDHTLSSKAQYVSRQKCEGTTLILPGAVNPVFSELADSPMW
ncbi:calcium-binding and coiled-coil domain-containing protein 1-like isoform X2 [Nelusetta ayraudi]|uniref:calcium-binding and coiled-coil domain-containing protein 1-like isoform X2 n=1 Tax=Nelusetta ayraudi TaxID=303726 RepID=UPI003F6FE31C